jgi:NAD(P)H-hydrate epimerase
MTAPLPCDNEGRFDLSAQKELFVLAQANDVLALGPGLGRSAALTTLLSSVLKQVKMPIVVDADGLYGFAANASHLPRAAPLILTPHPGEFSRVAGVDVATVQANRRDLAAAFAKEHGVVLLLKGHRTIVTDGNRLYENTTGNPGMATAGSGDVLTGLIAALLAQKLDAFSAAQLGADVHGLAGDLAKADVGEIGMTASDVLDRLPRALKSVQGQ